MLLRKKRFLLKSLPPSFFGASFHSNTAISINLKPTSHKERSTNQSQVSDCFGLFCFVSPIPHQVECYRGYPQPISILSTVLEWPSIHIEAILVSLSVAFNFYFCCVTGSPFLREILCVALYHLTPCQIAFIFLFELSLAFVVVSVGTCLSLPPFS